MPILTSTLQNTPRNCYLWILSPWTLPIRKLNDAKLASLSILKNPRWPPRWPPKSISGYNFCSRTDSFMKSVSIYGFSCMSNSIKYKEITFDYGKYENSRWPPRWPIKSISGHNFCSMTDNFMKSVSVYGFSCMSDSIK